MRYPINPKPIQTRNRITGKPLQDQSGNTDPPWTLLRYLMVFVFSDGWDKPLARQRIATRVLDAIEKAPEGACFPVADDDWEAVKKHLEDEEFTVPVPFNTQLLPLADAWLDAPDKEPAQVG